MGRGNRGAGDQSWSNQPVRPGGKQTEIVAVVTMARRRSRVPLACIGGGTLPHGENESVERGKSCNLPLSTPRLLPIRLPTYPYRETYI